MAGFGVTRQTAASAVACALALAAITFAGAGAARASSSSSGGASGAAAGTPQQALARRYLAIAEAGNRHLERDFDALEHRDRGNLVRARADLADAAATERLFDRRLRAIHFAPATERFARDLYAVNEMRATLTAAAAVATSLQLLHSYDGVLDAANVPVERDVAAIRRTLGLPPPESD